MRIDDVCAYEMLVVQMKPEVTLATPTTHKKATHLNVQEHTHTQSDESRANRSVRVSKCVRLSVQVQVYMIVCVCMCVYEFVQYVCVEPSQGH